MRASAVIAWRRPKFLVAKLCPDCAIHLRHWQCDTRHQLATQLFRTRLANGLFGVGASLLLAYIAARASVWPTQLWLRPSALGLARLAATPSTKSGKPVCEFRHDLCRGPSESPQEPLRRRSALLTPRVPPAGTKLTTDCSSGAVRRYPALPGHVAPPASADSRLPEPPNARFRVPVASRVAALLSGG